MVAVAMTTPSLKGDGTSDRTIVIRNRVGTHGPKDPTGRVRHHFMKLATAIEGKAALFKQFGGAEAGRWCSHLGLRSHRWRVSGAGYTALA